MTSHIQFDTWRKLIQVTCGILQDSIPASDAIAVLQEEYPAPRRKILRFASWRYW